MRETAYTLFVRALSDCSIEGALTRQMQVIVGSDGPKLALPGHVIDLARMRHVRIFAIGKAATKTLEALLPRLVLPANCDLAGVLISPQPSAQLPPGFEFFAGGHPMPNAASFRGAEAVLEMLRNLPSSEHASPIALCLFLISGGGSAMMELPLDPNITLEDTVAFHSALVHSGASIREINCVRKHFSAVKGGRLALEAKGAECFSLLISDAPQGQLDTIASGPSLPDTSTVMECREILLRYRLYARLPESVRQFFLSFKLPETPKANMLATRTWTVLDSSDLAEAARRRAEEVGFYTVIDNTCDDWDYRAAAEYMLDRMRILRKKYRRVCLISVGEVTVRLPYSDDAARQDGNPDVAQVSNVKPRIGGRNQHFALYAATLLNPGEGSIAILSSGSDGIDGNSTAAGAVIDEYLLQPEPSDCAPDEIAVGADDLRAAAQKALENYDSSTFLERRRASIKTGPTGNNLRDLRILVAEDASDKWPEDAPAGSERAMVPS